MYTRLAGIPVRSWISSQNAAVIAGSHEPCAYVEVKSIGALRPPAMTAAFCELIQERTGIPANRVYIGFEDVQASCWGWNGNTFG